MKKIIFVIYTYSHCINQNDLSSFNCRATQDVLLSLCHAADTDCKVEIAVDLCLACVHIRWYAQQAIWFGFVVSLI